MQSLNILNNPQLFMTPAGHLDEQVEALRSLLTLILREFDSLEKNTLGKSPSPDSEKLSLSEKVERYEADLIRFALIKSGGHQRRAARLLRVKFSTLNAKIKKYEINPRIPTIESKMSA